MGGHTTVAKRTTDACMDPVKRAARAQVINSMLISPEEHGGPVFVVAVDKKYYPLFLNWACGRWSKQFGDPLQDTVVIANDPETFQWVSNLGFKAVIDPAKHFGPFQVALNQKHVSVQTMLFCMLHQISEMGYDVVIHDVDLVWRRNPIETLFAKPAWSGADVLGANAPRNDAHGPMNSGFALFRKSRKTTTFLRAMVGLTPLMFWLRSDQVIYNTLLRHWRFRQLHLQVMPRAAVADLHTNTGLDGTLFFMNNDTTILHSVSWSHAQDKAWHKLNRLHLVGLMYVKVECFTDINQASQMIEGECLTREATCEAVPGVGGKITSDLGTERANQRREKQERLEKLRILQQKQQLLQQQQQRQQQQSDAESEGWW
eukprot:8520894-Pyramimonas_sp.AAC.1